MRTGPTRGAHPRWRGLAGALGALLAAGLLAPALATAEWTAPVELSAAGQNAFSPQVAVDADGDAVFTWRRSDGTNDRIQARARSAAGVLGDVQTLSAQGQNAFSPQVAIDADGDAVFTWLRSDGSNLRVQARARSAAGVLSPVQTLSAQERNASAPQVAVDADGDAVFTWDIFDGSQRVQAVARSAGGTLSAVQNISMAGQDASLPQVAVDADGDAVFTWERFAGTNDQIQARARSAAGVLSAVQDLTGTSRDADNPYVAVDPNGNAVFTWVRNDLSGFEVIQTRARSAAGALSEVQNLSDSGKNSSGQQVAVDADGDAVFTWVRDVINDPVQARARSAAGVLSPVQDISYPGQAASAPQVAVQASGKAIFTWVRFDGADDRVQARTRSAAGALRPLTTLSDPGQHAGSPQVGVDADGDAVVAWERDDGAFARIQASAGP